MPTDSEVHILDESRSRAFLSGHGISFPQQAVAQRSSDVVSALEGLAFPLAMKVVSPAITHKSDSGCVVLGIRDAEQAVDAYEQIVSAALNVTTADRIAGVSIQEMISGEVEFLVGGHWSDVFGPVITVGAGGIMVEVLRDVSTRLCPVSRSDVEEMLSELRISLVLDGYRGLPQCDGESLINLVLTVSDAMMSGKIHELDLNPVMVRELGQGAIPVDTHVTLRH